MRHGKLMAVIVLKDRGIAVWSPIALDGEQMARIEALGPVEFLIVPNQGHRLDLKPWKARYPRCPSDRSSGRS